MKVLLAHPGTQHAFALAAQLFGHESLSEFWTCFAVPGGGGFAKAISLLPSPIRRRLANRVVSGLSRRELKTIALLEFKALHQLRRGIGAQQVMLERNQRFQESIDQKSIVQADAVVGFDTSSWLLAERCKQEHKIFLLDQTTAHPREACDATAQVSRDFPKWSDHIPPPPSGLLKNQVCEHLLADLIVVASSFARDSLIKNGIPPAKIRLNPYGVDLGLFQPRYSLPTPRPVRFVFVGSMSGRKGVPLLLMAWEKLRPKDAELWLIGDMFSKVRGLIPNLRGLHCFGRKLRTELSGILCSCDVFVFPSYCEGFGLVLLEAMASGLPVITTTRTAGPDIVTEGRDGFVIEPGDANALVNKIEFCLSNRDRIIEMGANARRTAERFSWDAYGDRWMAILTEVMNETTRLRDYKTTRL